MGNLTVYVLINFLIYLLSIGVTTTPSKVPILNFYFNEKTEREGMSSKARNTAMNAIAGLPLLLRKGNELCQVPVREFFCML